MSFVGKPIEKGTSLIEGGSFDVRLLENVPCEKNKVELSLDIKPEDGNVRRCEDALLAMGITRQELQKIRSSLEVLIEREIDKYLDEVYK